MIKSLNCIELRFIHSIRDHLIYPQKGFFWNDKMGMIKCSFLIRKRSILRTNFIYSGNEFSYRIKSAFRG
jgi:hypothetical protein